MNPTHLFAAAHTLHGGFLLLLMSWISLPGIAESPTSILREGVKAFHAGNTDEASRLFERAKLLAEEAGKPLPSADYNLGRTAAERGEWDRALEHFQSATRTEDLSLLQDSHYNTAAALLLKPAPEPDNKESLQQAIKDMEKALSALRHSLALNHDAEDARRNFEIAVDRRDRYRQMLKDLEEKEQKQEEDKQEDDQQEEEKDQKKEEQEQQQKQQEDSQDKNQQPQNEDSSEREKQPQQEPSKPEPGEQENPQSEPSGDPQNQDTSQDGEPSENNENEKSQPFNLSPEESQRLLNAMREQEAKNRQEILHRMMMRERAKPAPVEKDW